MRIHSLQHVPFEDIGSMASDFAARGYSVTSTHWYRGDAAPALDSFDALIVMGGPMGIYDEAIYPWLADEKALIKSAIDAGKILLGICLGAQLIADVLGGKVTRNTYKEIGWLPLQITPVAATHPLAQVFTRYPEVFHWHGDTFALPPGALHLASSHGCANQAYVFQERVYGFQFHLETTPASAQALIEHCSEDIDGSRYTQSAQAILASEAKFAQINHAMSEVIDIVFAAL
ncbi:type 1 glutamine amidotransferase [Cellvibrio sp. NN19]|uniref:type 1 glutamine amidotransferase n=1 Tax=Cellvibrio chitinivorans TaxID=3102792 RepID=UPI002B40DA21|nr:type 1 glutamine amidotransferase [Cellvibrio sp. NN19]